MPIRLTRPYQPKTRKIEREYGRSLRQVARHIGDIIGAFPVGDPTAQPAIEQAMHDYAALLDGWARRVAGRMLENVRKEDDAAWRARSNEMRDALRRELQRAPTGELTRAMLEEQVVLIKSLPIEAGRRVHKLTLEGIEDGTRAKEIAAEIRRSGQVTASRAMLIARTEVARTASKLTQSRALSVGSEGYIWRTSQDGDVRHSHQEMEGKFVRWDSPPKLSDGTVTHAGQIYNCRCYPEAVIPD